MLTPALKLFPPNSFLLPDHYVRLPVEQKPETLRVSVWVDDLFTLASVRA